MNTTTVTPLVEAQAEGHNVAPQVVESRLQRMKRLSLEATQGVSEKVPQFKIAATIDEDTGDYIIRIPSTLACLHVKPSTSDKSFVALGRVEFPVKSEMAIEFPDGTTYHEIKPVNLNLTLGLKDMGVQKA